MLAVHRSSGRGDEGEGTYSETGGGDSASSSSEETIRFPLRRTTTRTRTVEEGSHVE